MKNTEESNPTIISLDMAFDEATCQYYWRATVTFDKQPNLKLGRCEVIQ